MRVHLDRLHLYLLPMGAWAHPPTLLLTAVREAARKYPASKLQRLGPAANQRMERRVNLEEVVSTQVVLIVCL